MACSMPISVMAISPGMALDREYRYHQAMVTIAAREPKIAKKSRRGSLANANSLNAVIYIETMKGFARSVANDSMLVHMQVANMTVGFR